MTSALEVLLRRLTEDAVLCETESGRLEELGDTRLASWWQGRAYDFRRMARETQHELRAVEEVRRE